MVTGEPALSFAGLLRQLRTECGLTQEELAAAARLSPRTLSDLERGVSRTAHKNTGVLLADALGLTEPSRALFVLAARGKAPTTEVLAARRGAPEAFAAAASRTLPRDIASFTGRQSEFAQLSGMLRLRAGDGGAGVVAIHAIDGMAGIGKTAFAVHVAHRLTGAFPDGQLFLPLHAHTQGQRPVDPADALTSLLLTAGMPREQIPPGLEARAACWRDRLAGKRILLLLDDAAGHEQVRPLLPGTAGCLVLVTSRRRLVALEDAAVVTLAPLPSAEAANLFVRLAGRSGIRVADPAVTEITRLCGCLPLAIGMLAGQLRHHPAWTAERMAAELADARDRLAVMRAENLSVAAAFHLSYLDLSNDQQRLFRRLGLIPGPTFDAYAAAAIDTTSLDTARGHLAELYDHHLLTELAPGRYQLHDLLREHARSLAGTDGRADCSAAIARLLDYYLFAALTADEHVATWTAAYHRPAAGTPSAVAPDMDTLEQAADWIDTERPNLHAAAKHAAAYGYPQYAVQIPAIMGCFLLTLNHRDEAATLFETALDVAERDGDRHGRADALTQLSVLQQFSGDYQAAAVGLTQALALYRDLGDLPGQGASLTELCSLHTLADDYPAATASGNQALALADELGDPLGRAHVLHNLSWVHRLAGDLATAAAAAQQALAIFGAHNHLPGRALALCGLGAAQREAGDHPGAMASLRQSLALFRDVSDLGGQAAALHQLGLVMQAAGNDSAALACHRKALRVFRDLGGRRGQAEALNSLGELSSRAADTRQARACHSQALAIARDIGAALVEACALEGLGQADRKDGRPGKAAGHLHQALAIYQRIGSARARRLLMDRHADLAGDFPDGSPAQAPRTD